jgi:NADP-dependent 3-hydroxy acid dehydrogenase YdfG
MSKPWEYKSHSISGQVALITGASSGIGLSTSWRLAHLGCNLILCGRRLERLEKLRDDISREFSGISILAYQLDVTSTSSITSMPDSLPDEFKEVDILVNNAGLALGRESIDKNSIDDVVTMINTNVTGLIVMTRVFSEGMKARRRGHIVNVSSIAGHDSYPGGSVYNAAKAAVNAFSTAGRYDMVDTPVRVSNVCPGMCKTEFTLVRHNGDESINDSTYADIVPLTPEDIADQITYCLTRPEHVVVADVKIYPTNQGSGNGPVARVGEGLGR